MRATDSAPDNRLTRYPSTDCPALAGKLLNCIIFLFAHRLSFARLMSRIWIASEVARKHLRLKTEFLHCGKKTSEWLGARV